MNKLLLALLIGISSSNLQGRDLNKDLAATMLSVPQVFTSDINEEVIQACALMDLAALGGKSLNIAHDGLDKISGLDKAKIIAYGFGVFYDLYAMINPDDLIALTKNLPREMKRIKRIQQAQVMLEAALRAGAIYCKNQKDDKIADLSVEAADLVGITRLMARHWPVPSSEQEEDLTQPTTTLEASKLALLRDESVDASLGLVNPDIPPFVDAQPVVIEKPISKKKQKKNRRNIIKSVQPIDIPQEVQDEVREIVYNPYQGWSGNPKDGWKKAPLFGTEEYRAWQKWFATKLGR